MVRERRAQEIDRGLSGWIEAGHGAEFVTLTVRHHLGDGLDSRLAVLTMALGLVLSGAPWKRRAARLGYVGAIRALEVTWGRNGWHPHVHAVLLFERALTDGERADLREWMFGRWGGICERKGFGSITRRNGVDVRAVTTAGDVASYLTKVDGGWGAGLELARADVKQSAGGLNPWQILGQVLETGETCWVARWKEYELATFARRAIVWSPGLRARLLGDETEQADEELAAAEGADLTLWRVLIERAMWNRAVQTGEVALVLDDVEAAAAVSLLLSRLGGREPTPLEGGT